MWLLLVENGGVQSKISYSCEFHRPPPFARGAIWLELPEFNSFVAPCLAVMRSQTQLLLNLKADIKVAKQDLD